MSGEPPDKEHIARTVPQPQASLIAHGHLSWLTSTTRPPVTAGDEVLIHASKAVPTDAERGHDGEWWHWTTDAASVVSFPLPLGAVVAVGTVAEDPLPIDGPVYRFEHIGEAADLIDFPVGGWAVRLTDVRLLDPPVSEYPCMEVHPRGEVRGHGDGSQCDGYGTVPVRGRSGWWTPDPELAAACGMEVT